MKRWLVSCVWGAWFVVAVVVAALWLPRWAVALVVIGLGAVIAYRYRRVARLVRAWGYAEGPAELSIRGGLLFRTVTVVPYGRMQVVEVGSGPIERHFGLATVRLVTASAETDATIPGLDTADADALRDRITALGEHQAAGL